MLYTHNKKKPKWPQTFENWSITAHKNIPISANVLSFTKVITSLYLCLVMIETACIVTVIEFLPSSSIKHRKNTALWIIIFMVIQSQWMAYFCSFSMVKVFQIVFKFSNSSRGFQQNDPSVSFIFKSGININCTLQCYISILLFPLPHHIYTARD